MPIRNPESMSWAVILIWTVNCSIADSPSVAIFCDRTLPGQAGPGGLREWRRRGEGVGNLAHLDWSIKEHFLAWIP